MPFDPDFERRARECIHTARYEGLPEFAALMEAHVNAWRRYATFDDTLAASDRAWFRWYWPIVFGYGAILLIQWLLHLHGTGWNVLGNAYIAYQCVVILRCVVGHGWAWYLRHCELRAWHRFIDYQRKLP